MENLDKHPNGKYNLGNGQGFSNLEVVKTIELVSGRKVPFEFARAGPEIRQFLYPLQIWLNRNFIGTQSTQNWKISLHPHGNGTENILMDILQPFRVQGSGFRKPDFMACMIMLHVFALSFVVSSRPTKER